MNSSLRMNRIEVLRDEGSGGGGNESSGSASFGKLLVYLWRSLLWQCPTCGEKPMFVPLLQIRSVMDWVRPLDGCPRCGYPFEREPGFFLMSTWAINYGTVAVTAIVLFGLLRGLFKIDFFASVCTVAFLAAFLNVLMIRHSKSIFLAFDLFFDPHKRRVE